jgi:hypothetical protein
MLVASDDGGQSCQWICWNLCEAVDFLVVFEVSGFAVSLDPGNNFGGTYSTIADYAAWSADLAVSSASWVTN